MKYRHVVGRTLCVIIALFACTMSSSFPQQQKSDKMNPNILPAELRCEYLAEPRGIDEVKPRLSWLLEVKDKTRGQKQTAYEILVSTSEKKLGADEADLWNSRKVESAQSNQVEYGGKALTPRLRCYWKVRVWDKDGNVSPWSATACWTMGLLEKSDWVAKWIGGKPVVLTGDHKADSLARLMSPSPLLRKSFRSAEPIVRGTMYVTALGLYEVKINGQRVGDHVLAPEWTDYDDRIQYQTYDVTNLVAKGENVISATLADGWYVGAVGCFNDLVVNRGKAYNSLDRKLLLQLEIETTGGRSIRIVSDESWRVNADGPVRAADIYLGETFDSRKEPEGWERPGFNDSRWDAAAVYPAPAAALVAQMNEPIRKTHELKPIALTEPSPGTYIFDMGQNMVGWCRMKFNEPEGREITIRHGEMLADDGKLYTENLRRATQTVRFIADGKGEQICEPRFTYFGFRYVEISGLGKRPELDMLVGKEVTSDIAATGQFECSSKDLNQLWKNILWTQWDNLIGIPTDCPQRDERLGWMADAQVFSQTAIYNSDMAAFYTKWVQDIRDAQHPDGRYPDVAPVPRYLPFFNAPAWADAGVIVPWRMYQNYGDVRILRKHYASAKRFVDFVRSKNPNLIWTEAVGNMYGDWLNGNTIVAEGYPKTGGQVPHCIFNTMHFAQSAQILAEMAKVLGLEEDGLAYARLAAEIRSALVEHFANQEAYIAGNTQAGYALALGIGLLPEEMREKAFDHMLSSIADYDFRISTGFLSTVRMMNELANRGRADIAYQLVESHRFPSWLYQIDQGATTIWERWDGYVKGRGFQDPGMNSFNHYAIGSVGEWMYGHILGIQRDEKHPGFSKIIIAPKIGGTLTWAKGKYHSFFGDIVSDWKLDKGVLNFHIEVPPNTSARVYVPTSDRNAIRESGVDVDRAERVSFIRMEGDAGLFAVSPGRYDFVSPYSKKEAVTYTAKPRITYERELDTEGNLKITLEPSHSDAKTYFSLDGTEPVTLYQQPLLVSTNTTLVARSLQESKLPSFPIVTRIVFSDDSPANRHIPNTVLAHKAYGKVVRYSNAYSPRHPGDGESGLVNGKLATLDHVDSEWQGFEGVDIEIVVDLGRVTPIRSVAANFLRHQSMRVFLPTKIEFSVSEDGNQFSALGSLENAVDPTAAATIKRCKKEFQQRNARYVKMVAHNPGKCPDWHPQKGQNVWLAVDEIIVE